jgi:peptidylprolyl isomerase
MKKDFITAIIVFVVIVAAGSSMMYLSGQGSSSTTPTPTPQAQANQQPQPPQQSDATLLKELQITDEAVGDGQEAKKGDTVTVNYIGTLQDGTKFDSSYDRNQPFSFPIGAGQVIKGWDLGVVGMKVGGKRKLVIPPDLAYGNQQQGSIPANSTLTFEIELVSIK